MWRQYQNPVFASHYPYIGVSTAYDIRVRPNHFALDYRRIKTVFRHDDPIWSKMLPPFGKACRCSILAFAADELETRGLTVGHGEDWYGKEVEVEMPALGQRVKVHVLPDSQLVKIDSSFAKFLRTRRPESVSDVFWREYRRSRDPKLAQNMVAYAENIIQQALKCKEEDKYAHAFGLRILGGLAEFSGETGKAIECYEKAISLNPQIGIKRKLAQLKKRKAD
jgi:tetratricopeptide (TPR) repeat protein